MAERQQSEYWLDFGDEGAPRALKDRAQWHESRRQRVVASILLELHLMAATGLISRTAKNFKLVKARWQDDFGSADNETQAAHCVPRQMIINTKEPQEILRIPLPDRSDFIRGYFAKTDTLPANFNKSDSRCEHLGLVEGFRLACLAAISSGHEADGKLKFDRISVDVKSAFDIYKILAKDAYLSATARLGKKLVFPKPLPENERKWKQQLLITENYAHELRYSNVINTITQLGEIEELVRIYKKIR